MTPRLSVVMPMRNVAHCVQGMLDDLLCQETSYKLGMELIVVDDASTDNSAGIVENWSRKNSFPLLLIRNDEQLWSYGSRLAGMAMASGQYVWNIDADDRIPHQTDLSVPLKMAEALQCDILHCRAVGVRPPSPLHLPLTWTEPVADELAGDDIFKVFMAQNYPPGTLCNKFFSGDLVKRILKHAPAIEVRYFDVKFLGLLSLLFAESCHACNDVIYEYRMRTHRPAEMYARQVDALLLLNEHLTPAVKNYAPDQLEAFEDYCARRLTIQTGHLCIMAREELAGILHNFQLVQKWLSDNIYRSLNKTGLLRALAYSLRDNSRKISCMNKLLLAVCGAYKESPAVSESTVRSICANENFFIGEDAYGRAGCALGAFFSAMPRFSENLSGEYSDRMAVNLILANAALAALLTRILAPQTDITKRAN